MAYKVLSKWPLTIFFIFYYSLHPSIHASHTIFLLILEHARKTCFGAYALSVPSVWMLNPGLLYHCLQTFAQLSALWGCLRPAYLKWSILLPCFPPQHLPSHDTLHILSESKLHEGRDFVCSLLYTLCLEQCLAHRSVLQIFAELTNEWISRFNLFHSLYT